MPLISKSFPARALARAFLERHQDSDEYIVLGLRDYRLDTMAYVWHINTDRKQLRIDRQTLSMQLHDELQCLVVDLESHITESDLFKEEDRVIEMHANRCLRYAKLHLYKRLKTAIATIDGHLAAPPPKGSLCQTLVSSNTKSIPAWCGASRTPA